MTKKTHVHLALASIFSHNTMYCMKHSRDQGLAEQRTRRRALRRYTRACFSLAAIYAQISKRNKAQQQSGDAPSKSQKPFEVLLLIALKQAYVEAIAGSPITLSYAQDLFKRTVARKHYHNPMSIWAHLHISLR